MAPLFLLDGTPPAAKAQLQMSMEIDPWLSVALEAVPPDGKRLALLNLQRGRALGLTAGADVADALGLAALTETELLDAFSGNGPPLSEPTRDALAKAPPLWFYILREAQLGGGEQLGPVGGTIVAGVLAAILDRDPESFVHAQQPWPLDLRVDGVFRMRDLIAYVA